MASKYLEMARTRAAREKIEGMPLHEKDSLEIIALSLLSIAQSLERSRGLSATERVLMLIDRELLLGLANMPPGLAKEVIEAMLNENPSPSR